MNTKFEGKNLIILGAGHDQLPMYQVAKKLGIRVIGVDKNPKACAIPLADRFINVSTREPEVLLKSLADECIQGIISPASDASHETIYQLSHHYQLPWKPSLKAVHGSIDKYYFLHHASKLKLIVPKHYKSSILTEIIARAKSIGYPLMVKPIDSSGSKGISYVEAEEELERAFYHAREYSWKKEVIIEQYIEGDHYSVELFRRNGQTIFEVISEKIHTGIPNFITLQHMIPAALTDEIKGSVHKILNELCGYFEVNDGPANFDFIIKGNEIYFIEMGARLAGNGMPALVQQSFGLDTYELALHLIFDQFPNPLKYELLQYSALQVLTACTNGTLKHIRGLELLSQHPAFVTSKIFTRPGEPINVFTQSNHKLGYIIAAHPDIAQVRDILDYVKEVVHIEIEGGL